MADNGWSSLPAGSFHAESRTTWNIWEIDEYLTQLSLGGIGGTMVLRPGDSLPESDSELGDDIFPFVDVWDFEVGGPGFQFISAVLPSVPGEVLSEDPLEVPPLVDMLIHSSGVFPFRTVDPTWITKLFLIIHASSIHGCNTSNCGMCLQVLGVEFLQQLFI
jgi:hypothetical protein